MVSLCRRQHLMKRKEKILTHRQCPNLFVLKYMNTWRKYCLRPIFGKFFDSNTLIVIKIGKNILLVIINHFIIARARLQSNQNWIHFYVSPPPFCHFQYFLMSIVRARLCMQFERLCNYKIIIFGILPLSGLYSSIPSGRL
jgi:hypothetical protein